MSLFAWLLGVAAITLDNAVYYTVVTMGNVVKELTAVGVAWRILRDITNIMLIFGFLAIGISTILDTSLYGWTSKLLPMLIISAVCLNFSLFISEAVIDTGNLFATQFYTQINGGKPATKVEYSRSKIHEEGISNKIMSQLGLQRIYGEAIGNTAVNWYTSSIFIGFMGIMLFMVAAFVMFTLAFILIARFVILVFLIIFSPMGFAGLAVPKLKGIADDWWSELFKQTVTAPILLLMLYIALAVITDAKFLTGFGVANGEQDTIWTGWINNQDLVGFAGMMLSYLIAMGLLMGVAILSKKLGAFGSSTAMKWAGKASFGVTGMLGRSSVGWLATKSANGLRRTAFGRIPLVGTGVVKGFDRLGRSNFDARSSSALKDFPFGGVDAGKGQQGGYKADLKSRIEKRTKYAADLKGRELTPEEKVKRAFLVNELKKYEKERDAATDETGVRRANAKIKAVEEAIEEIDSVTDKGAQREYARNLLLRRKEDSFFNKWVNPMANTEAAKKIRSEAKKSSDDKALEALIKKAAKEDSSPPPPPPGPPPP